MPFYELYIQLNNVLDQMEEKLHCADSVEKQHLSDDLTAIMDLHESILENWLHFDKRIQRIQTSLTKGVPEQITNEDVQISFGPTLPIDSLSNFSNGWGLDNQYLQEQFRKGIGFFDLEMFRDSARVFKEILNVHPELPIVRLLFAISQLAGGEVESADQEITELLQITNDPLLAAAAWDARAQMYAERGEYLLAKNALSEVLEIRSDYVDARVNMAICSYALGDYSEAVNQALVASDLDPNDSFPWRLMGAANFAMREYDAALISYQNALLKTPEHPSITIEAARILKVLHRYQDAEVLLRSLVQNKVWASEAYLGLAELSLLKSHYPQAVAYLKKRLSLVRKDPTATLWLAYALYGSGEIDIAKQLFISLCYEESPICFLAKTGLARIATDNQEIEEAKAYLRDLSSQKNTKWRAYGLAEFGYLYAKIGQTSRAVRYLHRSLELVPDQSEVLLIIKQISAATASVDAPDLI